MNPEQQIKWLNQLIAKCWADASFKQKLIADSRTTLRAEGVQLPAGLRLVVVEDTDTVMHLVIPTRRSELSDEDLAHVGGGKAEFQSDQTPNYREYRRGI